MAAPFLPGFRRVIDPLIQGRIKRREDRGSLFRITEGEPQALPFADGSREHERTPSLMVRVTLLRSQ